MKDPIRVLLVDDQKLFVDSLHMVIESRAPDIEVVAVAYDGETGVQLAQELTPDLVIMDVRMPGMDGVEAARQIIETSPDMIVLMLTTFDDDEYVYQAILHGAAGYLLKDMPPEDLIASMHNVTKKNLQISSSVLKKLLEKTHHAQQEPQRPVRPQLPEEIGVLSSREHEILHLVAAGLNNQEIAETLHIASQTVKNRISELYFKFDVHDRLHLIRKAKQFGYGSLQSEPR